jgi:tetratricopeptide (TPR) repeat protein
MWIIHPNPLLNSPFGKLPPECRSLCFSYLSETELGRLARVCKPFNQEASDNTLWKPLHYRKWNISHDWIGPAPESWKVHYQNVSALSRLIQQSSAKDDRVSLFWKAGMVNEEILSSKHLSFFHAVMGNHEEAKNPIEGDYSSQDLVSASEILELLQSEKFAEATQIFADQRDFFITFTLLGAWISALIDRSCKESGSPDYVNGLAKEKQIFFPNEMNWKKWKDIFPLLRTSCMIWLSSNQISLGFQTFECFLQIKRRLLSLKQSTKLLEEDVFFKNIRNIIKHRKNAAGWEKLGDIYYQSTRRMEDKSELHKSFQRAAYAYGEAIKLINDEAYGISLGQKLAHVLTLLPKKLHSTSGFQLACTPVLLLKKCKVSPSSQNIQYFHDTLDLIRVYKIDLAYSFILTNLESTSQISSSRRATIRALFNQIELYRKNNQYVKAVDSWLLLNDRCPLNETACDPYNGKGIQEILYTLLDESPDACQKILSLKPTARRISLSRAYAFHRQGKTDQALRCLIGVIKSVQRSDVDWLMQIKERRLMAMMIYSLTLKDAEEIGTFFFDLLDDHHQERSVIYHNLIVRLYFEGFFEEALDHVEMAKMLNPNQWRTKAVIAMIDSYSAPEYSQEELLIIPA